MEQICTFNMSNARKRGSIGDWSWSLNAEKAPGLHLVFISSIQLPPRESDPACTQYFVISFLSVKLNPRHKAHRNDRQLPKHIVP